MSSKYFKKREAELMSYLRVPIDDAPTENISRYLDKISSKMFDAIQAGGRVLITCRAGIKLNLIDRLH